MNVKLELINQAVEKIPEIGTVGAMVWLVDRVDELYRPKYGAAGAYHNGSLEQRAKIDAAIAQADGIMSAVRATRDRRKMDLPYQANGLPDRRQADRRDKPRHED